MAHLTDETLLAAMAAGDTAAAAALVRRYQARAFGLAVTIIGDRTAAEDVAQEAFVRMWRHAGAFDAGRGSVEAWLLTIVRNAAVDMLRMRRHVTVHPDEAARLTPALVPSQDADDDERDVLRRALAALPEDQRRAVVLSSYAGWTASEIAEREAIPLGTVKSRVRLGLAKLRDALEVRP